jgi:ribonuclease VapC
LILDSSAVLAVLFREKNHARVEEALDAADLISIGAPTLFETTMVAVARFGLHGRALVAQFIERWDVTIAPFSAHHASVALEAFVDFGKGRHPARLNLGDCLTYATAQVAEMPLLFTGDDFTHTDIVSALSAR